MGRYTMRGEDWVSFDPPRRPGEDYREAMERYIVNMIHEMSIVEYGRPAAVIETWPASNGFDMEISYRPVGG